eukprot:TRINITY_DN1581_c0_g2_i1.p1 TRINITY_DN1581_c0_g2~~TRINITY_DN1581_c0_g2_i1.p1  ORF type:complete len:242 (+),score=20.90 TRINITY_DN1581_c0_g2_i1:53-778(+)
MGSMHDLEDPEEVKEEICGKEKLDRYSVSVPVVVYNIACMMLSLAVLVWVAIVHTSRDLNVLVVEGVLTAMVVTETTVRILIVGCKDCCKYPVLWLDALLCYFCLALFLGVVLLPHLIYDNDDEYESAAAIILLVLRFIIQVIRGGVLAHRQQSALKRRRVGREEVVLDRATLRRDEHGLVIPPRNGQSFLTTKSHASYGTSGARDSALSFSRWSFTSKSTVEHPDRGSAKNSMHFNPLLK